MVSFLEDTVIRQQLPKLTQPKTLFISMDFLSHATWDPIQIRWTDHQKRVHDRMHWEKKRKTQKKQTTAVCINPPPGWNYQIYLFVHNTSTYYAHQQYYRRNILMRNTWHFVQNRNNFGTRLCENDVKVKSFSTLFVPNPFIKPLFSSRLIFFFSLSIFYNIYYMYMRYVRYMAVEFHEPVRLLVVSCYLTTLFCLYYIIFMWLDITWNVCGAAETVTYYQDMYIR